MRAFVLLLVLFLAGCGESMDKQNRLKTYGQAKGIAGWPAEGEALPRVKGTVAQGDIAREQQLLAPPPVSMALLKRGHERYDIYCSACHGLSGEGDGIVVARGFPKPRPFDDPSQMNLSARDLVASISNGYEKMYSFSDRVEPRDRWAIAAYVRALQLSRTSKATQ